MGVRYATINDAKEIAKINIDSWITAFKGIISDNFLNSLDYEKIENRFKNNFDKNYSCVYENEANQVLGFCIFGDRRNIEEEGYEEYDCELYAIYINPEYKGQGIGKQIFSFVTKELKKANKTKMILWVLEKNEPSIKFYEKRGGKLISKKQTEIGDEIHSEISFGYDL